MPNIEDNTNEALSQRIIALEAENKRLHAALLKSNQRARTSRATLEVIAGSLTSARNTVQSEAEQLWKVTGAISAHQDTIRNLLAEFEKSGEQ